MERLTTEYCGEYVPRKLCSVDRLGGADDCDLCCEYCNATEEGVDCKECAINECFNKLGEYENLEEQGKLLKLPCSVGDMVWDIDFGRLCSYEVTGFSFGSLNDDDWEEEKALGQVVVYYINSNRSITGTFAASEIGKTVFLTKEEAEQAVKERGKGELT